METKIYTLEEAKDLILGKIGTERRDKYEHELKEELEPKEIEIDGKIYQLVKDDLKNCDNCEFLSHGTICLLPNYLKQNRDKECFSNNYEKVWKLKK